MAQGQVKAKSLKPASKKSSHQTGGITKKGSRSINARNAKLQKQAKMNKKLTSGMTAQTERMLGEKAGHLEMIGSKKGSKKEKDRLKKASKKKRDHWNSIKAERPAPQRDRSDIAGPSAASRHTLGERGSGVNDGSDPAHQGLARSTDATNLQTCMTDLRQEDHKLRTTRERAQPTTL